MERLQAAITKARQKQTASPRAAAERPRDMQPVTQTAPSALWQALPEVHPDPRLLVRNRIVAMEASPEATPFDMLRTRTLRLMQEQGWHRLAITSPSPGCGKSTIALNLAFSMARQPGTRAISIEADMRQPSHDRLLGLSPQERRSTALADVVSGDAAFGDAAVRRGPGLAFLTNDAPVRNASDILLGDAVGDALARTEADYQPHAMIFDMPPVLVNDDTMAFMQHVDCVLIVAAAERSTVEEIDRCERELASQTNVLGVVLNKCHFTPSEYSGYGY